MTAWKAEMDTYYLNRLSVFAQGHIVVEKKHRDTEADHPPEGEVVTEK